MNQNYKELNIQKSLYRGSQESFAERLERLDPTENYRGTELGSLDAFQRQLKRFDIQVGGSHSSTLEKFFQNGQSAVLFPEYLMRAVRQGMEENDPLSSIVAARTLISATDYRGLTTNDDLEADVTGEAAALSATTIGLKDKTTALKKRGRMLRASYEAVKFQRLDLFTLALRRIGAEIARCQMKDAVSILMSGDGSTGSALPPCAAGDGLSGCAITISDSAGVGYTSPAIRSTMGSSSSEPMIFSGSTEAMTASMFFIFR